MVNMINLIFSHNVLTNMSFLQGLKSSTLQLGFEEIDIREAYYANGEDAVIMVKREKTHGLVSSER